MTVRYWVEPAMQRALAAWRFASDGGFHAMDRSALYQAQRGRCYLCISPFVRFHADLHLSRDHVFPRSAGGGAPANVLLAHVLCNTRKQNRWPTPCEVIYLAAAYAQPFDAAANRARKAAQRLARAAKRRAKIESLL